MGVAQLIRDHRGLWAMGGQDLILGYGEIRCGELHCSQIYRPGLRKVGDRTKILPYTNFYIEVLTLFWIKLLHVEVLTNFRIKPLYVEVLTIFPDKTSTLTKSIKKTPPPPHERAHRDVSTKMVSSILIK